MARLQEQNLNENLIVDLIAQEIEKDPKLLKELSGIQNAQVIDIDQQKNGVPDFLLFRVREIIESAKQGGVSIPTTVEFISELREMEAQYPQMTRLIERAIEKTREELDQKLYREIMALEAEQEAARAGLMPSGESHLNSANPLHKDLKDLYSDIKPEHVDEIYKDFQGLYDKLAKKQELSELKSSDVTDGIHAILTKHQDKFMNPNESNNLHPQFQDKFFSVAMKTLSNMDTDQKVFGKWRRSITEERNKSQSQAMDKHRDSQHIR